MKYAILVILLSLSASAATYDINLKVVDTQKTPVTADASRERCYKDGDSLHCRGTSNQVVQAIEYTMMARDDKGIEYVFGCQYHGMFSHCQALNAGDTFRARMDHGRLVIECYDSNHKLRERKYDVYHIKVP